MGKWRALTEQLSADFSGAHPNPPATEREIREVEETFGVALPQDMREYLLEMNGDNWLMFSVSQIIETNAEVRKQTHTMPLDCLLFVGGNGCGDYFGYPITGEGLDGGNMFMWEHEYDSRVWRVNNLRELINRYYGGEI